MNDALERDGSPPKHSFDAMPSAMATVQVPIPKRLVISVYSLLGRLVFDLSRQLLHFAVIEHGHGRFGSSPRQGKTCASHTLISGSPRRVRLAVVDCGTHLGRIRSVCAVLTLVQRWLLVDMKSLVTSAHGAALPLGEVAQLATEEHSRIVDEERTSVQLVALVLEVDRFARLAFVYLGLRTRSGGRTMSGSRLR